MNKAPIFPDNPRLQGDVEEFIKLGDATPRLNVEEAVPEGFEVVSPEVNNLGYETAMGVVFSDHGLDTCFVERNGQSDTVDVAVAKEAAPLWKALLGQNIGEGLRFAGEPEEPWYPLRVARAISADVDSEVGSLYFVGDRVTATNGMNVFPNDHTIWATQHFRTIEFVPMLATLFRAVNKPEGLHEGMRQRYDTLSELDETDSRKRIWGEAVYKLCNLALVSRLADNPELIEQFNVSVSPEELTEAKAAVHLTEAQWTHAVDLYFSSPSLTGEQIMPLDYQR